MGGNTWSAIGGRVARPKNANCDGRAKMIDHNFWKCIIDSPVTQQTAVINKIHEGSDPRPHSTRNPDALKLKANWHLLE